MSEEPTTAVVQRYLDALAGDAPAEPIVRELLDRAVHRLERLCATMLHRSYPRLTRPPTNLETAEMLGGVVEGLLKAMRSIRPQTVRQFFALANQHMRWQLNDCDLSLRPGPGLMLVAAHRLDHRPARLLALAAGLRTRFHLGRVELVALGRTRLARLGTGRTGMGHERALVGDEVGREVAELRTVGDQMQGFRVLLPALRPPACSSGGTSRCTNVRRPRTPSGSPREPCRGGDAPHAGPWPWTRSWRRARRHWHLRRSELRGGP